MSYNSLIDLQKQNLFDIPLKQDSVEEKTVKVVQTGGDNENLFDMGKDSIIDDEMALNEKKESFENGIQFGGDLSMSKVDIDNDLLSTIGPESQIGGSDEKASEPQLFDKIELKRDDSSNYQSHSETKSHIESHSESEFKMSGGGNDGNSLSVNFENIKTEKSEQSGGAIENPEGVEISEITDDLTEENLEEGTNINNPGEDLMKTDYENPDKIEENMRQELEQAPPAWIHPDLNMEEDPEMIVKMNQEEIENKVMNHINNYNSEEYNKYIKYYQAIYSASNQKYGIRINNKGDIYLIKRPPIPKELKNKKVKETVQDIINDTSYEKDYLIKLTPPEYLDIKTELDKLTKELNVLSGHIKLFQDELIELGSDISGSDIKKFEKLREKFYKLINKKYIYTKYFEEINSIVVDEERINMEANEIISYTDDNDIKSFKLESRFVNAPNSLISDITSQIKENIENYKIILDSESEDKKRYNSHIKDFIENKNKNNNKINKEIKDLITFSKNKVNFLIKKMPKIDIKNDVLFTEKIAVESE